MCSWSVHKLGQAEMTTSVNEKEDLGRAIGRIATGVFVVSLERDGQRDGMLTSFLNQMSFEPPMITFAVKKERHILNDLKDGTHFVVNVLGKANMDMFKSFAKPHTDGLDRFEGHEVAVDANGNPYLKSAVSYLSCSVKKHIEAGDHVIILAEIVGGALLNAENEPMTHLRKNGFGY